MRSVVELVEVLVVRVVGSGGASFGGVDVSHGVILSRSASSLMMMVTDCSSRRTLIFPCENQVNLYFSLRAVSLAFL